VRHTLGCIAGARGPAVVGLTAAAIGMAVPEVSMHPASVVAGVAVATAGTGAMFVIASATAAPAGVPKVSRP
jgi:hypothetical protein